MKTTVFSSRAFERNYLTTANNSRHELILQETHLSSDTADLAKGSQAICLFVSDDASAGVLEKLSALGVKFITLRSAGYNHVDIDKAKALNITVARVPGYSPYSVAEHAVTLMLALNRKLIRARQHVTELNFSLDGLAGFDMYGKTAGIIGTGKIGSVVAKILHGFGCRLLAFDPVQNELLKTQYGVVYTDYETLCKESDIITLHVPLTNASKYIINRKSISIMKPGVMLINTGRGPLVNTQDVIEALKTGKIGYFGMDVYENEQGLFFDDHSDEILQDDTFARLMAFNNVLITGHQAFLTDTALKNIARTTIENLDCFENNKHCENSITG